MVFSPPPVPPSTTATSVRLPSILGGVLLTSPKQGRWEQKRPKMLLASPKTGRWEHFAGVRQSYPKSQDHADIPGFRQNRAGRGALEGVVAGVGLNGWPISACRAEQYAPQAPGTKVSLHGFGENPLRGTGNGVFAKVAGLRPGSRVSPKPCRVRGAGGCCSGVWAARVADFGDPCRAICPTGPWNGGQLARFWRKPT